MSEVLEQESKGLVGHSKYTRNNPFLSTVRVNELQTAAGSEKETRHIELTLDEGMIYTPGDSAGILPENRAEAVAEILALLGFRGDERVLDHYKVGDQPGGGAADAAGDREADARQLEAICEAGTAGLYPGGGPEGASGT